MTDGLDERRIREMVTHFYGHARVDPLLGPVFEDAIAEQWAPHIDTMVDFWASVLLGAGRYSGNPRAIHAAVPGISPTHFERWLELFEQTLQATFDAETAAQIHTRARAMARGLMSGIHRETRVTLRSRGEPTV